MATQTTNSGSERAENAAEPKQKSPGRRLPRLAVFAAALALAAAALPTLVSRTPLGNLLLGFVAREAKLNGSLSAGSLSFGWFSPLAAHHVELRDAEGSVAAKAESVETDKTLWAFLRDRTSLGGIKLTKPTIELALRDDGSNLEDVFAAWLPLDVGAGISRIDCALEIVDGEAIVRDVDSGRTWKLAQLKAAFRSPGPTSDPIQLVLSAELPEGEPAGRLSMSMRLAGGEPPDVRLDATALPLEAAQPLLRRLAPGSVWEGRLDGELHYHAGAEQDQRLLEGEAVVARFALAGPMLASDSLSLAKVELPFRLDWRGDHLTIDELGVACDVGELTCYGTLADSSGLPAARSIRELAALAAKSDGELEGRIDLAKLARLLPGALRIREGTEITAGEIKLSANSRPHAAGRQWQGGIETARLVAVNQGQELSWDQPLAASFAAHSTDEGAVFDKIACESEFLKLEGAGTPDKFTLSGTHDLARLTSELARFIDLGGAQLTGAGDIKLGWRRIDEHRFVAESELETRGFSLVWPGRTPWTEEQVTIAASATGELAGMKPTRIETALCQVLLGQPQGGDRLNVRLSQPIELAKTDAAWPIEAAVTGELSRWLARMTQHSPSASTWQFAGECNGKAKLAIAPGAIGGGGELTIANFAARSAGGSSWNEPQLKLVADVDYDRANDALQIARGQVVSSAAEINAKGKIADCSTDMNAQIAGQAAYDLAKLQGVIQAYLGKSVQLAGRETRPFSLSGPLAAFGAGGPGWTKLSGDAELAWQSANVYGTPLASGQVEARLAGGIVRFSPLEISLSGGKVRLAPAIELGHSPIELSFAPGRVAEQVQITREMCNAGMKYALPVLAEATQAQGRFSIDLEGCQLPLANPRAGDAAGKIIVHSVEVGPGPLTQAFAPIVQLLAQALGAKTRLQPLGNVAITRESQVDVRMVGGRVYHRGLELIFPDVTVRTYGSVGLDESLAIMAEMPVPDKWIGNNALGDSLRGQVIRLPIAGTLHQPKIDGRELERLAGRVVEDTAKGMLQKEIGRQLDKLFGPLE
jgi:hypothetical protein